MSFTCLFYFEILILCKTTVKYTLHAQTQCPLMKVKMKGECKVHPVVQHLWGAAMTGRENSPAFHCSLGFFLLKVDSRIPIRYFSLRQAESWCVFFKPFGGHSFADACCFGPFLVTVIINSETNLHRMHTTY